MLVTKSVVKQSIIIVCFLAFSFGVKAGQIIKLPPSAADMTPIVREALEKVVDKELTIILEPGIYNFLPDYAFNEYRYITNHDNGLKNIIFPFKGFKSITIEGHGAELIFHGQVQPFLFEECGQVRIRDVTVDWNIPFLFQGTVTANNPSEGWWELLPFTEGFSWKLKKGKIEFPGIDGYNFTSLGSTLTFDPATRQVSHGSLDITLAPSKIEKKEGNILRFYDNIRQYPAVGTIVNSKGPKGENRYAPAIHIVNSQDVEIEGVVIHHALGMGFLFERTDGIKIRKCGVYCRKDSPRMVSVIADATHFANCKGDILIVNCRFENMLDDGTNVHGTYVTVDKQIGDKTLRIKLEHFQQLGFEFAGVGDEIWFIHKPSPLRQETNKVVKVVHINDRYTDLTFRNPFPSNIERGDVLENKTWNPNFTMRRCEIRNHRARNIVLKTPLKIVIEENVFSSMMSSIFFRGETFYWFESGNVEDVLIQKNRFIHCAYSGAEHAVMYVTPRLGKGFESNTLFDRNIRFIDNEIETFDNRIIWADRVDGLIIKGNSIKQLKYAAQLYPESPTFDLINCRNVTISDNHYEGDRIPSIEADAISQETIIIENNKGMKLKLNDHD